MVKAANNYAFISYSHKDAKVARWLQHRIEQYVIPQKIYEKISPKNLPDNGERNLRPIFLDESDLNAGLLKDSLTENLKNSKYLIVICSPDAAKSSWVSDEVEIFIQDGRLHDIILFVVGGTPYLDLQIAAGKNPEGEECIPKSLVEFTKRHPENELLGIETSRKAGGMEKAAVRVISKMLGVNFDVLWDRQARTKRMRRASIISTAILLVGILCFAFIPLKLTYSTHYPDDGNTLLMPDDAVLTIDGVIYPLGSRLDTTIILDHYFGYQRGKKLPVLFTATYFDTIRTEFDLGHGFGKDGILYLRRDNTFAIFSGRVIDQEGNPIYGAKVSVKQNEVNTDENGSFKIILPPEDQAEVQAIVITRAGYYDVYRPDECPSENLTYIMYELD